MQRIQLRPETRAKRGSVVSHLTIGGDPDPRAIQAGVGAEALRPRSVLNIEIGLGGRGAIGQAVVDREQTLGVAATIVCHHVKVDNGEIVLGQFRQAAEENVAHRLRCVAERRSATARFRQATHNKNPRKKTLDPASVLEKSLSENHHTRWRIGKRINPYH